MQRAMSYLHESLSLPVYNKTGEFSFEDVFSILTSNLKSKMILLDLPLILPFYVIETSSLLLI